MRDYTLRAPPTLEDSEWKFTNIPADFLVARANRPAGKFVKFSTTAISLYLAQFPSNRVLHNDDQSQFVLVSFSDFRSEQFRGRVVGEYIMRLMKAGLFLNGVQYRFYHHSNSQLRGRSCFMRRANTDAELDQRIYHLGDYGKIMNVAKRAKRIGLLFSGAEIDYQLDPARTADIPDLKVGDEVFSDGCGLMSRHLAVQLSKQKGIVFRNVRYTPSVYQIRYRGYKGVLMLHLQLDQAKKHLAQFRGSMKKFTATLDNTFSVVDYSKPYAFGRLNNDIIVLLSSLGIESDTLRRKQMAYFTWIRNAATNIETAVDFLSSMGNHPLAERVLLDGLDDPEIQKRVRSLQNGEISSFRKNDKPRARMMVHKSRLLFGVCDPFRVLKEGEVHVRITVSRKGATTLRATDVLVVRNPCMHPGDCLKLRAVEHPLLAHLVDCVVFASQGRRAAPAMSSGGDLDGDKFLVCWDPDLVPNRVMESYGYPPNREHISNKVTREDLVKHFASYNTSGMGKAAALHLKWARNSPDGALCSQCQELNALYSQAVDGASVKFPDRLLTPPESEDPYIIDLLTKDAVAFAAEFLQTSAADFAAPMDNRDSARETILRILQSKNNVMSEYELFNAASRIARAHEIDMRAFIPHIDFGALSAQEKYTLSFAIDTRPDEDRYIWNSLFRSDILTSRDLTTRELDRPLRLQRLYTSREQGLAAFFEYLQIATQDFTRKLIILKTDERFAVGIFIRGEVPWDEDPEVNENVVVCSFMPKASSVMSTYRSCTAGYRLHCSEGNLQLYDKARANTFIFLTRPAILSGGDVAASIALQKISGRVQQQIGRLNRTPVTAIEIHVVSNRDRVAHQLFDLRFEHVDTETILKHQMFDVRKYTPNSLVDFDWENHPEWMRGTFTQPPNTMHDILRSRTITELEDAMKFAIQYRAEDQLFAAFKELIGRDTLDVDAIHRATQRFPPLAFALLKAHPADEEGRLPEAIMDLSLLIAQNAIRSANALGVATLVALEKISATLVDMPLSDYLGLLMLAALSVRSPQLVQETLLVLHDVRGMDLSSVESRAAAYALRHGLAIAVDRAEEAADECPCDENGKPSKQRKAPTRIKLLFIDDDSEHVVAHVRVDLATNVRLHSHVRLTSASTPDKGWLPKSVLDGVVTRADKGEMRIRLQYPPPPEMDKMDWNMYNAGSIATAEAMMEAVRRLATERAECCRFYQYITDQPIAAQGNEGDDEASTWSGPNQNDGPNPAADHHPAPVDTDDGLNDSQRSAVRACDASLSLIWGPPGTGKTTVVIQILRHMLRDIEPDVEGSKILVTASTHNAVDNILERFVSLNNRLNLVRDEVILRVATDHGKVNKTLQSYTIDARVGGDMNVNERLRSKAEKRVKEAVIIFSTCTGAGLGILRKMQFGTVIIDEASQVTEPCALIPLVKGCQRAVLVGDHVQLRPTVRPMAKALEYDKSLMERLYTSGSPTIPRTMLDVQYRFPKELAAFPSRAFYNGKLRTAIENSESALRVLRGLAFPWPRDIHGGIIPVVFVQCATEEDMGGSSKSNDGQAELVARIVDLLRTPASEQGAEVVPSATSEQRILSITALTPYSKQVKALQGAIAPLHGVSSSTIDSFQGRESDVIVFSTVRCNVNNDIGFVEDARRLNVAWTRAKLALIVVGDRKTMTTTSALWKQAIDACTEVSVSIPVVA